LMLAAHRVLAQTVILTNQVNIAFMSLRKVSVLRSGTYKGIYIQICPTVRRRS
jgi:hypothetical protein